MRKQTTAILDRKENGGMHRQKAYRNIRAMFDDHGYERPRLYHIVLTETLDLPEQETVRRFQDAVQEICRKLRRYNMPTRWRAALELDDKKGLHFHVFILVNARHAIPGMILNTSHNVSRRKGKRVLPLRLIVERQALGFYLCRPRADIHYVDGVRQKGNEKDYAEPTTEAKLADCLEWISYLVKVRSKPKYIRNIYFSSRDSTHPQSSKKERSAANDPVVEKDSVLAA